MTKSYYDAPKFTLEILSQNDKIEEIKFCKNHKREINDEISLNLADQLDKYFNKEIQKFDININLKASNFQTKVYDALLQIPYGEKISYKELAKKIGNENAFRAVANANAKNKFIIIIPCHRVIKSNGQIGGYIGGENIKKYLLELENSYK